MEPNSVDARTKLEKDLPDYLFVTSDSVAGRELIRNVVSAYYRQGPIRLCGDRYFADRLKCLLESWGREAVIAKSRESENDSSIHLPGPDERRRDLPLIISFMISDILKKLPDEVLPPRYICGATLHFLLMYRQWSDFQQIRNYLEVCLTTHWDNDTITFSKSADSTCDIFVDHITLPEESRPTSDGVTIGGIPLFRDRRPKRYKVADELKRLSRQMPPFSQHDTTYLADYFSVSQRMPYQISHRFPLRSIGQVLQNAQFLIDLANSPEGEFVVVKADSQEGKSIAAEPNSPIEEFTVVNADSQEEKFIVGKADSQGEEFSAVRNDIKAIRQARYELSRSFCENVLNCTSSNNSDTINIKLRHGLPHRNRFSIFVSSFSDSLLFGSFPLI